MPSSPTNKSQAADTKQTATEHKPQGEDSSSLKGGKQSRKKSPEAQKRGSSINQTPRQQSGTPQAESRSHKEESSEQEGKKNHEQDKPASRGSSKTVPENPRDSNQLTSGKSKEERERRKSKQERSKISSAPDHEALHEDRDSQRTRSSGKIEDGSFKEDSIFDYKEFRPYGYGEPVIDPRVVLFSAPAPCSCYPKTSSRAVPSMLYDQVHCVHHGNVGCPHEGVYNFDAGWNDKYQHQSESRGYTLEDKSYVRGYPRPELDQVSESRRSSICSFAVKDIASDRSDGNDELHGSIKDQSCHNGTQRSEEQNNLGSIASKPSTSKGMIKGITSKTPETLSHRINLKFPITPDARVSMEDIQDVALPQIGFTPPTSSKGIPEKLRSTDRLDSPVKSSKRYSPIDAALTSGPKDTTQSLSHTSTSRDLNKNRTFKGRYYDPVTDQVYTYEVTHEFGKHMNRWPVKREKCGT
ncbi:micronuclear linker histone polyprotein-like [Haliotis cracherodii]|uniref:micronuclear linker histone polyprotein-like n=1 Tax=Haliotis cracherodii TaxID=6455 RepID=UPI0039E8A8C2